VIAQWYSYGLDDRGSRIRFPAGAGNFFLRHRVQNGSGAHPTPYPMGGALFFFFNRAPRHEGVLGEWRYRYTQSSSSALDGGEWSASRPGRFIPRERANGNHWIGGWVGPRTCVDTVVKSEIPSLCRDSKPQPSSPQPSAIPLSYPGSYSTYSQDSKKEADKVLTSMIFSYVRAIVLY
jgi:hypothetical protein